MMLSKLPSEHTLSNSNVYKPLLSLCTFPSSQTTYIMNCLFQFPDHMQLPMNIKTQPPILKNYAELYMQSQGVSLLNDDMVVT